MADSLGCDVLNTSLGYATFDDSTMDHTYADPDGQTLRIDIAAGISCTKGVRCKSAGNNGQSDWHHISAPADAVDILTVGAVGDVENHAPFGSFGPGADGRVKPDVCAMGWDASSFVRTPIASPPRMALPSHRRSPAGLVACLWQLHPERNATDIMEAVRRQCFLLPHQR
ncbi:MAG: S8 family serine peptidase [Flavobacteriales bacterium]|nr:S8 family serine peptidase [Flavobacteriales bacterium]